MVQNTNNGETLKEYFKLPYILHNRLKRPLILRKILIQNSTKITFKNMVVFHVY